MRFALNAHANTALLVGIAVLIVAAPSGAVAQVRRESIQGRAVTKADAGVPGARVLVTRGPDRAVFEAKTDGEGRFAVRVDSGTGEYLLYIAPPPGAGLQVFRKRVTRQAATDSVFVIDAILQPVAGPQQLGTVRVQERRPAPTRADERTAGPGAAEALANGVSALVGPDQAGDLHAIAATLPAISSVSGDISVFGLPASQNLVTLDGLGFAGFALPREARTRVRVLTSTFDPSRGWFGGAETRVEVAHDFLYSSFRTSASLDAPSLQAGGAASASGGREFSNVIAGIGASGFTGRGKVSYNTSAQVSRRTFALATLPDLNAAVLRDAGVARDSVAHLLASARALGVPLAASSTSSMPSSTSGSLLFSLSTLAEDRETFRAKQHVGRVSVFLARDELDGSGLTPLRSPSVAQRERSSLATLQATLSSFLRPGVLHEVRAGVSSSNRQTSPFLAAPRVVVDVSSQDPAHGRLAMLEIGGAGQGPSSADRFTWEAQSETRFFLGTRHRVKLSADVRYDALDASAPLNANGTYSFASLRDFNDSRPSVFTRQITTARSEGRLWNGYVSLGDYWRPSPLFELVYGVRTEATVFGGRIADNPAVESAFDVRTGATPNLLHISPRIGFTWTLNRARPGGQTVLTDHGTFMMPALGVLRGGLGEFRSLITPDLLATLASATGAIDSQRSILCAGSTLMGPDWARVLASPADIPTDCEGAAGTAVLRDTLPSGMFLGRDFTAPRSWRANLSWTSHQAAWVWTVEGTYSRHLSQLGASDLNLAGMPAFALSDEAGRPVYALPEHIVQSSGFVSSLGARRNPAFGAILQSESRRQAEAVSAVLTVLPDLTKYANARLFASASYVYTQGRAQVGGFDGTTFLSPNRSEWTRSPYVAHHGFVLQASVRAPFVLLSIFGRLSSGQPFTPIVDRDINGDGRANDRAFVFDPSVAEDSAVRVGMRALLNGSAREVRKCLGRQLGQPAKPNDCAGPWTTTLNARLSLNTGTASGWRRRLSASLYLANIPAGLDQLLHGAALRGWGDAAAPDAVLLRPVGFDPVGLRFRYVVNPRFGTTHSTGQRPRSPFRVSLDLKWDLGASTDQQILDRNLRSGRAGSSGTRRSASQMRQFYLRTVPDPFALVLALSDSLLLTPDQIRTTMDGQSRYRARVDTVVASLASWLAALPERYNGREALRRQEEMFTDVLNVGREEIQRTLGPVLHPAQRKLLPWPADVMFRARGALTMREIRR